MKSTKNANANKIGLLSQRQIEPNSKRSMSSKAVSAMNETKSDSTIFKIVDPEEQNRRYKMIMEMHR